MQRFVGKRVNHKAFGKGIISEIIDDVMVILFDEAGVKKLGTKFLNNGLVTLEDSESSAELDTMRYNEKVNEVVNEYNRLVALIPNNITYDCINIVGNARNYYRVNVEILRDRVDNTMVEEYHNRIEELGKFKSINKGNNKRLNNLVFKTVYCDGGKHTNGIGFSDICSKDLISYNVRTASNCSREGSYCKKFFEGEISRQDLERKNKNKVCYECHLFRDWTCGVGSDNPGNVNARARTLSCGTADGATFLSTRLPNKPTNDMFIYGVFLIGDAFYGDEHNPGYVEAHEKYRLQLTYAEAEKILLRNYFADENGVFQWKRNLCFGIDDSITKTILKDIIDVITDHTKKKEAQDLLDEYVRLHP